MRRYYAYDKWEINSIIRKWPGFYEYIYDEYTRRLWLIRSPSLFLHETFISIQFNVRWYSVKWSKFSLSVIDPVFFFVAFMREHIKLLPGWVICLRVWVYVVFFSYLQRSVIASDELVHLNNKFCKSKTSITILRISKLLDGMKW